MTSPQEFDGGIDETDRDNTEAELAAAIAGLLAGHAAGTAWLDLVQASLTGITQNYLRRSSMDMAAAAGLSGAEAAQAADEATTAVLGDVERHTAAWLKIAADDRAPGGGGPLGKDEAETAAGMIARTLSTYARERVRGEIAKKLGATRRTWVTRGDDKVRSAHRELAGKWKPEGKPFTAAGFKIMYPGDPEAPLELTAGCRCHLAWSIAS